ncbi:hypothetical protein D3C84_1290080 [compost metagenome]
MCIERNLYSANDLRDVAQTLAKREGSPITELPVPLNTLPIVPQVYVEKRPMHEYIAVLKGTNE